jgi:DNA transformation protein
LPGRLFDDPEELSEWARAALGAAQRAALKKRPRGKKAAKAPAKKAAPKVVTKKKVVAKKNRRVGKAKRAHR